MDITQRCFSTIEAAQTAKYAREGEAEAAQVALPSLLSGRAAFESLKRAVEELQRLAPDDCDVLITVDDLAVLKARFIEPHTLSFEGLNKDGHHAWVVIHFSQLHAAVVYRPKGGPARWVTEMEIVRGQMV